MADCSKRELQRPERFGRRYLTTAYGGQSLLMKRSGTQTTSNLEVCWLAKFVSKVRRYFSVLTRVDKESELEIDSLPYLQPVQLAYKWGAMWSYHDDENTSRAAEFITD